jgi:ribosomal-protein-alanine N-acetyltransferase
MKVAEYPFEPVTFEDKNWSIHPFRAEDFDRFEEMAHQIFQILSDERTIRFIPEKKLVSLDEARLWLQKAVLDFHAGLSYIHFIRNKKTDHLVGVIAVLSPALTKEYYRLSSYPYFIEFYLEQSVHGNHIMSKLLPVVIGSLRQQGILKIAAVVNRNNMGSRRVLEKAGFGCVVPFDFMQDLYLNG